MAITTSTHLIFRDLPQMALVIWDRRLVISLVLGIPEYIVCESCGTTTVVMSLAFCRGFKEANLTLIAVFLAFAAA